MGRKCPRLRAFLLHYVALHLGVSSGAAQDFYTRYIQERPEPPRHDNGVKDEEARVTIGKRKVTGDEHDGEGSSDWDSDEEFTKELLSDTRMVLDLPSHEDVPGGDGRPPAAKRMGGNDALIAVEHLSAIKKRMSKLEVELAKTENENAVLLETVKSYTLKAIAAEKRPLQIPSPEVLERALEAGLMKRKEIYRKELLEEWNRVHDRESGRTSKQQSTYDKNPSATAYIMVPSGSVALHAAVNGFVEALGIDDASPHVLDLLQWVSELSDAVDEMDVEGKTFSIVCPQHGVTSVTKRF